MASAQQAIATVEDFLMKVGAANTEAGSIGGDTTHPVKNVEDNTRPATEGARSAENSKDVKEDQGKPSVDSTPEKKAEGEGTEGTASGDQLQIGTQKGPTGTNVPATKPGKTDPGTTHPARTDNEALNGGKYASAEELEALPLEKLAAYTSDLGNDLCAQLIMQAQTSATSKVAQAAQPVTQSAATVGNTSDWAMAGLLDGSLDKQAADALVVSTLTNIVKEASEDADRTAEYLTHYYNEQRKQAEDPAMPGGIAPGSGAGPESGAGPTPEAGAGGPPPEAGAGGGAGGGEMSEEQLMQLLQQLGITPEQLEQAIAAEQGGGAGGPGGPGAGGADPAAASGDPAAMAGAGAMPPPPPGAGGMQVQAADRVTQAKVANYVVELMARTRTKAAQAKVSTK